MSKNEWPHEIDAEDIGEKATILTLSPPEECKQPLCNRLNLYDLVQCKVKVVLMRHPVNKVIHVDGQIVADVVQKCVVTTDPVEEHVEDTFEAWYVAPSQTVSFEKARRERMSPKELQDQPILGEEDDPEEIVDGKIDLGELATQYLSLALNPYPKAEGAAHESASSLKSEPDGMYDNPFAALKDWKASEGKKGE